MSVDERVDKFTQEVLEIGGVLYTKEMMRRFIDFWTEPDRSRKPKLRFEKQKTWRTSLRLAKWANSNYDRIICFLSVSEKTIAEKRKALAEQMRPFLSIYTRSMLNEFYRFYSQPENKINPQYLRWELMEFWDLSTQLASWADREAKRKRQ